MPPARSRRSRPCEADESRNLSPRRIDLDAIEEDWEDLAIPPRRDPNYSPAAQERIAAHDEGRVVGLDRGWVTVVYDGRELPAVYAGSMRGERVVVGDRVRVRPPRHETDTARILDVLERDSVLARTGDDQWDDERLVVANADQAVAVAAADHLDAGVRLLDRVSVAASAGGLGTACVVNKIDLVDDRSAVGEVAARYDAIGIPVAVVSAETGEGLEDLERLLAGQWSAFAGHSGVGKSSLFNRLVPEAGHEVGELGRYGGRHTTVAARAVHAPALDAWLVDTPGVRAFGLGTVAPEDLADHFPELRDLDCALDDCTHSGEPGCRVDDADIHPDRLDGYYRLLGALRGRT